MKGGKRNKLKKKRDTRGNEKRKRGGKYWRAWKEVKRKREEWGHFRCGRTKQKATGRDSEKR